MTPKLTIKTEAKKLSVIENQIKAKVSGVEHSALLTGLDMGSLLSKARACFQDETRKEDQWCEWVENTLGLKLRTAQHFIQLYEHKEQVFAQSYGAASTPLAIEAALKLIGECTSVFMGDKVADKDANGDVTDVASKPVDADRQPEANAAATNTSNFESNINDLSDAGLACYLGVPQQKSMSVPKAIERAVRHVTEEAKQHFRRQVGLALDKVTEELADVTDVESSKFTNGVAELLTKRLFDDLAIEIQRP